MREVPPNQTISNGRRPKWNYYVPKPTVSQALIERGLKSFRSSQGRAPASNLVQGPFPYHFPIFQVTFPIFQDKNQCQNICRAFAAEKKALVLSDFSDSFQLFKIYLPIIQVSRYDFAPGSSNRPPIHASRSPVLVTPEVS